MRQETISRTIMRLRLLSPSSYLAYTLLTMSAPPSILNALKTFKPHKAPGPNGIHPFLYQKYWNIIGEKTMAFVDRFLLMRISLSKLTPLFCALFQNQQFCHCQRLQTHCSL